MTDLTQFSALVALWVGGLGLFAFLFQRLDGRIDRLETEMRDGFKELRGEMRGDREQSRQDREQLRRDLAEEFRAQRAEVAAQVSAIANAIIAGRDK